MEPVPLVGVSGLAKGAALAGARAPQAWADALRDWAVAALHPVLTAYAVWVTALVVWAYPWAEPTEPQRLNFLGWALIGALCLIGLATLFYQRRPPPRIRAKGPAMEFEVSGGETQGPDVPYRKEGERPAPEGRGRGRRGPGLSAGGSGGAVHKPRAPSKSSLAPDRMHVRPAKFGRA